MSIRTRILLLLALLIAVFGVGIAWLTRSAERDFRSLALNRLHERTASIEAFLQQREQSLQTFVFDSANSDGMAAAMDGNHREQIEKELPDNKLDSYNVAIVWIYKPDGSFVFARNHLSETLRDVPLPKAQFAAVAAGGQEQSHFYTKTPLGILEVRGEAIHGTTGAGTEKRAHGCLFAGRIWSKPDLEELSHFTGYRIDLEDPAAQNSDAGPGVVIFRRALNGWDERPIADLTVRDQAPLTEQFKNLSIRLFLSMALFSMAALGLLAVTLRLWVTRPLRMLSACLRSENPAMLGGLTSEQTEFGYFARMMRVFFEQRQTLMDAMRDRQHAEKALRESEEQLRQSHKMEAIGQLSGGIAHDFNNLLTAIIGYSALARDRVDGNEPVEHDIDMILKAADQAAALTRQLLTFSRKQVLNPRVIDLNALVGDVEKLLQRLIGEHIELRVRLSSTAARVRADRAQLEQVLLNLSVNARDAMPRGGMLTIETSDTIIAEDTVYHGAAIPAGHYVTLKVTDTGCGMDEETMKRIFEPFFTTKEAGKGTGLGLATVYGVVRQSSGVIGVESEPGVGTTFIIHLPLGTAAVDKDEKVSEQFRKAGDGQTILVAEDNQSVRELICSVLENEHFTVICAESGVDALDAARKHPGPISLLITDVVMPRMSGPELAKALSGDRPGLKLLFISGYMDDNIHTIPRIGGAVELLEKPFTPPDLVRKVWQVLGSSGLATAA